MTTGRWTYPDGTPRLPPRERPLRPELPTPPYCEIDGVPCLLEYVPISELPRWRKAHNLQRSRTAFMGRLGYVGVNWPKAESEDEA